MPWRRKDVKREPVSFDDTYLGLRARWLDLDPSSVGLDPDLAAWGAMLELGTTSGAVATVCCLFDGTTGMYLSNGGGTLGAGAHAQIHRAAERFLTVANASIRQLPRESVDVGFPLSNQAVLRSVGAAGRRAARFATSDLSSQHPLVELFQAGQDVITELRLLQERRDRS